jgi:hypothetical protein
LKIKDRHSKTNRNEPESEAEKFFRISGSKKTNPNTLENESCYLIENTE